VVMAAIEQGRATEGLTGGAFGGGSSMDVAKLVAFPGPTRCQQAKLT